METFTNDEALLAKFQKELAEAVARIDALTTELSAAGIDPSTTAAALVIRGTAALSIRFEPAAMLALVEDSLKKNTARLRAIKKLGDGVPVQ